jgi:hypothetical protein
MLNEGVDWPVLFQLYNTSPIKVTYKVYNKLSLNMSLNTTRCTVTTVSELPTTWSALRLHEQLIDDAYKEIAEWNSSAPTCKYIIPLMVDTCITDVNNIKLVYHNECIPK